MFTKITNVKEDLRKDVLRRTREKARAGGLDPDAYGARWNGPKMEIFRVDGKELLEDEIKVLTLQEHES